MRRVLLVEDEPAIADTLEYALGTECFSVCRVMTGEAALAACAAERFDLVILDIGLPDMTGLEVCRRLRGRDDVPVLFLTARDSEMDRVLGLELGGDDYVTKPFSPREVVARVRAILRRTPARPSGAAEQAAEQSAERVAAAGHPALEHHADSMRVSCHGVPLDLTAPAAGPAAAARAGVHPRAVAGAGLGRPRRGDRPHGGRAHQVDPRQAAGRASGRRGTHPHPPRAGLRTCGGMTRRPV